MKITINKSKCIGCEACIKHCPVEAIQMLAKTAYISENKCIACKLCIKACLLDAIELK